MKLALVCCTLLTGCAVLLAIIWDSSDGEVTNSGPRRTLPNGPPYPGGTTDNIFWFIQITDIHISRYTDPDRAPDLSAFLKDRVPAINPELILVSGDLTDAKTVDRQGSRQYEDEWQLYWKTIQTSGVLKSTVWLDIRGNHDAFDVASLDSRTNFFRKYSVQGGKHDQSYAYELKKSFGTYNFIGLDACPNPGPKRPFNFFGYLSEERVSELERLDLASRYGNMTIWFGHYPSSTIVNMTGIRRMLGGGIAYLCGHLHTLGNLVPNMYANQYAGYLELELGDWKDNRMYRVLAVDHDMLSFTDESIDQWPVILVTNPKHAQFQVPNHEPLRRVHNSTHIRVLVFSPWAVDTVTIEVDDVMLPGVQHAGKGLYVVPWSPKLYTHGLHIINVYAKDSKGNIREVSQPFSLDGSRPEFRFLPSLILMSHISTIGMLLFMLSCLSVILPLFILRRHQHPPQFPVSLSGGMCAWPVNCVYTRLRWIWMAAKCDIVYYTFNSFTIYVAIGPWFVGYLLNEHLGLVFSWGIYIHSAFMPGSITYYYGFFQILTFNIPLLLYFGYALDYNQRVKKSIRSGRYLCWRRDWYLVLLLCFQSYMAYGGFYLAYGGVALLICPVRTWSVVLAIALFSKTVRSTEVKGFQCEENSR